MIHARIYLTATRIGIEIDVIARYLEPLMRHNRE